MNLVVFSFWIILRNRYYLCFIQSNRIPWEAFPSWTLFTGNFLLFILFYCYEIVCSHCLFFPDSILEYCMFLEILSVSPRLSNFFAHNPSLDPVMIFLYSCSISCDFPSFISYVLYLGPLPFLLHEPHYSLSTLFIFSKNQILVSFTKFTGVFGL